MEPVTYLSCTGSMYGYYGLWYSCWTLSDDYWDDIRTDCELMLDLKRIPCRFPNNCVSVAVEKFQNRRRNILIQTKEKTKILHRGFKENPQTHEL